MLPTCSESRLIAADARKRGHRRSSDIEQRVDDVLTDAIKATQQFLGVPVRRVPHHEVPPAARGRVETVIEAAGRPVAGITSVFQAQSGGNPQRVLAYNLPNLQLQLDGIPLELIVIVDGRGLMQTSDRTLATLFNSVAACMTLAQAEDGGLVDALQQAAADGGARASAFRSLDRLVESALLVGRSVAAADLPGELPEPRFALARYIDDHPELGLSLTAFGNEIKWDREDAVKLALQLTSDFHPDDAIRLFAQLLGQTPRLLTKSPQSSNVASGVIEHDGDVILPERLLVFAAKGEPTTPLLRDVSRLGLTVTPASNMAVLVTSDPASDATGLRHLQATLPTNVTTVDPARLLDTAQGSLAPRDSFVRDTVEQADLTKVSPFVTRGASPARMFFGRETEEATLLSALSSNSVAVLGGRRIGKTSLLHHAMAVLSDAGYQPYFGDCQTVRTWEDFGALAAEEWNLHLTRRFRPHDLITAIDQLTERATGRVVLLLDEIDQLLEWDAQHSDDEVPEPFFRALRTLSQAGSAQFVFSGERLIARKLWDPHSPHWNFCQPLELRQLTRSATEQLLLSPLRSLQIEIGQEESFVDHVWSLTSGHPQLAQALGDQLVRMLNDRPISRRRFLGPDDVVAVGDTYEFREQYLQTYWGQATNLERLISVWLAMGRCDVAELRQSLADASVANVEAVLPEAIRILHLYGIVDTVDERIIIRAEWFALALKAYAPLDSLADRLQADLL